MTDEATAHVQAEICGQVGCITLNRPRALNALSLPMVRALAATLHAWRDDPRVQAVAVRGMDKEGPFGAFCAGGDIRFFHHAALRGDAELEDFFTEEYALNHLIHSYPKPYIAFLDGIVMGGGMGISGHARPARLPDGRPASLRIVTARTKMAMPETVIGLFPDVGGGYFLSRCPGATGEWLALTGDTIGAGDALALGLADMCANATHLPAAWDALLRLPIRDVAALQAWRATYSVEATAQVTDVRAQIDLYFSLPLAVDIVQALEQAPESWARTTAATLRRQSPLMLEVTLALVRQAREMRLAEDLRLERALVRHCFNTRHLDRFGAATETVEGIRALVIDKDRAPRWNPARLEDVTPAMVEPFFDSPWPADVHPLRALA